MFTRLLHLVLLIFICTNINATPSDSLEIIQQMKYADSLGEQTEPLFPDEVFTVLNKAKKAAQKKSYWELQAQIINLECYYRLVKGQNDSVVQIIDEAISIFSRLQLPYEEAKCHARKGLAWLNLNEYTKALKSFFTAKELAVQFEDKRMESMLNTNIGLVYESLTDWDNALIYAEQALNYKIEIKDSNGIAAAYNNLGNIYYYQSQTDEALKYMFLCLRIREQQNDSFYIAATLSNIGNAYEQKGNADSAIYFLNTAMIYQDVYRDQMLREWCISIGGLAAAWQKKGDLTQTGYYLERCYDCFEIIPDFAFYRGVYKIHSAYYKQKGDYQNAAKYLEMELQMQDSITADAQNLENQKMAIRYGFAQKAKEDSLKYQLKITMQESATATYRNSMYLSIAIGALVLAAAIIIISRLRFLQKVKRHKELQQVRQEIAGDLHDDIGSTLSSIQILSSMMVSQSNENPQMKEAAGNISRLSDKVSAGMREIVWSLNPANDSLESTINQMRKTTLDILASSKIKSKFHTQTNHSDKVQIKLPPKYRKDLMMLFKEAINNARKYSEGNLITINILQQDKQLTIDIEDNGKGFDIESVNRGNGLNNMERRTKNLQGIIQIDSKINSGTRIHLSIPLP